MTTERKNLDRLHVLDSHGSRRYVYPADVRGRFSRLKPWVFAVLILIYVTLPFIRIGGHPAILIDIPSRHFYLFGKVFNAQDFYLFYFLLTGVGFSLIALSALFGRVWCGWACPQTVFLEGIFRRIERLLEGSASQRSRLAEGPWTGEKILRKGVKHLLYLGVSFCLAHVLLAYFVSMPGLLSMIHGGPRAHVTPFLWALAFTTIIYLNFWWFREQLCLIVCPYGRLQSALQDQDTVVIGYDRRRGEPRGKVGTAGAGDCVDCGRCMAVCPTDIDIRNGLQLECVGCAYCIDACDEIMDKLGRARGLIRYDSERGLNEGKRRFWRGRVYGYVVAGMIGLTVATTLFLRHQNFEANVLRGQGAPYVLEGDMVRNQFLVHLVNKNPVESILTIAPEGHPAVRFIVSQPEVRLPSLESQKVPVVLMLARAQLQPNMEVRLQIRDGASGDHKVLHIRVLGPPVGGGRSAP